MVDAVANPGFETNTAGWESNAAFGAYVVASFARTTSKFKSGVASNLVTWPAPSGTTASWCNYVLGGHEIGRRHRASMWVWVPTGAPDVRMDVAFLASGAATSVKDAWVQIYVDYDATAATHHIGVATYGPPTAGTQVYMDDLTVVATVNSGAFKSPLNMPAMTMQQLVNRGSFGAGNMPRLTMQQLVNRGSFGAGLMPRMTTDMVGTVAPPRKILIDGVLKNVVRVKWPT